MGYLKPLPREYIGEKHVVTLDRHPDGKYEWEERPGPGPPAVGEEGERLIRICFVAPPQEQCPRFFLLPPTIKRSLKNRLDIGQAFPEAR